GRTSCWRRSPPRSAPSALRSPGSGCAAERLTARGPWPGLCYPGPATVPSFLLTIAYDGSAYAGWQRQAGFDTVQERLERACAVIFGEPVGVEGASRTDAGVHALRQAACVRLPRQFPPEQLLRAMNGNLPRTISVRAVTPVPAEFHARFSAVGKRYVYRCATDPIRP